MATIKADKLGRNWLLVGRIAEPRTFGPEFGDEPRHTPPGDPHYSALAAYVDTIDMKNVWMRMVWNEIKRNAERLHRQLTARGCQFRVEDGTLWVMHPHLLTAEEIDDIEFQKPRLMRLISDEGCPAGFESRALVPAGQ